MRAAAKLSIICCFALTLGATAFAQTTPNLFDKSCRTFVQGFYDWYVPVVLRFDKEAPWHMALRRRPRDFSSELTAALKQSDAEAKADGDPVLDFEPLLDAQDPAAKYKVDKATAASGRCFASVSASSKPKSELADVVAELVKNQGQWVFVNFRYPNGTDLMSILHAHYEPEPTKPTHH
jgi:hypothetical protein